MFGGIVFHNARGFRVKVNVRYHSHICCPSIELCDGCARRVQGVITQIGKVESFSLIYLYILLDGRRSTTRHPYQHNNNSSNDYTNSWNVFVCFGVPHPPLF